MYSGQAAGAAAAKDVDTRRACRCSAADGGIADRHAYGARARVAGRREGQRAG